MDSEKGMNKYLPKTPRSLILIGIVIAFSIIIIVPYGNKLMDSAVSLMDPLRYKTVVSTPAPFASRLQLALGAKQTSSRQSFSFWQNETVVKPETERNVLHAGSQNYTAVIIVTYMRSGSSLTGEIMQQHPDAFYVFEPLRMLDVSFKANFPLQFLNGTYIKYGQYEWDDIAVPTLRAWITCDLESIYQRGLLDKQFLSYGRKTDNLSKCINQIKDTVKYIESLRNCVRKLREICLASKYRVVKTIRTTMRQIKGMMSEIPQLKILHLVRDPRDTMMSQKTRQVCGKATTDDLARCSAIYCSRLSDDILMKEEEPVFNSRVLTVFYEDIAYHAIEVCSAMYSFVGLEVTDSIKKYVNNLTSNQPKAGCKVCQEPWQVGKSDLDATAHVEKWRKNMPTGFRVIVDILCKESILYLNYTMLSPIQGLQGSLH